MKWKWWLFYVSVGAVAVTWYAGYFIRVPLWAQLLAFGLILALVAILYRDQRRVRNDRFQQRADRLEREMWTDSQHADVRGVPVEDRDVAS